MSTTQQTFRTLPRVIGSAAAGRRTFAIYDTDSSSNGGKFVRLATAWAADAEEACRAAEAAGYGDTEAIEIA